MSTEQTVVRRKAALAASVGTLLEYYDYYLFGLSAAVVFPKLFFPDSSPLAGQLYSFAAFAVGFILRPIGGIVLGHIADRVGRQKALVLTIMMMGVSTFLIGVLPGYRSIGVAAPILLVVLRLAQGFSTGGEMGGATALAVEHARADRRGLFGALLLSGSGVALFISSGLMSLVSSLPGDQFLTWGWRLPYWLSVVLLVAGLIIRSRVPETPVFAADREQVVKRRLPLWEVLRRPRPLVLGVLFGFANSIGGYVLTVYGPAFLKDRGSPASVALTATMIASGVQIVLAPTWGILSDRVGRKPVFLGGCIALAVLIFPIFAMFSSGKPALIYLGMTLGFSVCVISMSALSQTILSELFGTSARATGVGLGYQLTAVLAGGFAPMIASALTAAAGGASWGVCLYMIGGCVLSAAAIIAVPESAGRSLAARRAATVEAGS
ncbi:MFS transporter [Actinocatenispora comari]|uniref:Shikimate transporter n=1 Tax=Actinocatenispora comari TaxID=2807577 RepID=A0A8J4EKZ9_9ACTN|nr:MFS transporter [Actinocatenispora comari]GIL25059.1 shikimate transporter [Actinocatenispora comari]